MKLLFLASALLAPQEWDDPLAELVKILKESSPGPRRDLAVRAILSYGQSAAGHLEGAKIDPALFPGYRLRDQDLVFRRTCESERMNITLVEESLQRVIDLVELRMHGRK